MISVDSGGSEANGASGRTDVAIDADASHVAFDSVATDLVSTVLSGGGDIFLRDRAGSTTTLVSRCSNAPGQRNTTPNRYPDLDEDADVAAFSSSKEYPGCDPDSTEDVWRVDLASSAPSFKKVSTNETGAAGNGSSRRPSVSADGMRIAFETDASNLVGNDGNKVTDIVVWDATTSTILLVSRSVTGQPGNGPSRRPSISADGKFVAFESDATDLVVGDVNGRTDVFRAAVDTNEMLMVSLQDGSESNQGNSKSFAADISGDATAVAFVTTATNLGRAPTKGTAAIYLRTLAMATTERVDVDPDTGEAIGDSDDPAVNDDGSLVAFATQGDFTANGNGPTSDVLLANRAAGTLENFSVAPSGAAANAQSVLPALSRDGAGLGFASEATNLDPAATTGTRQTYYRDTDADDPGGGSGSGGDPDGTSVVEEGDFYAGIWPASGNAPLVVTYAASEVGADGKDIVDVKWTSGTSSTYSTLEAEHIYADPGTYTVTIEYTTAGGLSDTHNFTVTVSDFDNPPVATVDTVTPDDLDLAEGQDTSDIYASAYDDKGVTSIEFDIDGDYTPDATTTFDGNQTSVSATYTHTYAAAGNYRIHARAYDTAGQHSMWTEYPVEIRVYDQKPFSSEGGHTVEKIYLPTLANGNTGGMMKSPAAELGAISSALLPDALVDAMIVIIRDMWGGFDGLVFGAILAILTGAPATNFATPVDMRTHTFFENTPWSWNWFTGKFFYVDIDTYDMQVKWLLNIYANRVGVTCTAFGDAVSNLFDDWDFSDVDDKICDEANLEGWGLCGSISLEDLSFKNESLGICKYTADFDDEKAFYEYFPELTVKASWKNLLPGKGKGQYSIEYTNGNMGDWLDSDFETVIDPLYGD